MILKHYLVSKKKNKSKIKEKGNLLVLSIIAYVSIVLVKYI